jgi:mannonate dehydratase
MAEPDLALVMGSEYAERWELAKQMGVDTAVASLPATEGDEEPWEYEPMRRMVERYDEYGLDVDVIESRPPMEDAILGREGRDEQIGTVKTLLRSMGELGIDTYCWIWMAPQTVLRTDESVPARGGSLTTRYDHAVMQERPSVDGTVPEEALWENLQHFLDEVVPVAEEAGVNLALHPDDPPLSPIRRQDRIVTSVENYERILSMYDSPNHGITMCQGNFAAMGADIPAAIRRFGDRIHFAHVRDVEGTADDFVETWHDEGPTDLLECMKAYRDIGFDGPMRPDHVPTMAGEDNTHPGYHDKGRLFAIGYLRGLIEAAGKAE